MLIDIALDDLPNMMVMVLVTYLIGRYDGNLLFSLIGSFLDVMADTVTLVILLRRVSAPHATTCLG
jgi:hypothetical protein